MDHSREAGLGSESRNQPNHNQERSGEEEEEEAAEEPRLHFFFFPFYAAV